MPDSFIDNDDFMKQLNDSLPDTDFIAVEADKPNPFAVLGKLKKGALD